MDQSISASLSHTHYWYEVGMLKVPERQSLHVRGTLGDEGDGEGTVLGAIRTCHVGLGAEHGPRVPELLHRVDVCLELCDDGNAYLLRQLVENALHGRVVDDGLHVREAQAADEVLESSIPGHAERSDVDAAHDDVPDVVLFHLLVRHGTCEHGVQGPPFCRRGVSCSGQTRACEVHWNQLAQICLCTSQRLLQTAQETAGHRERQEEPTGREGRGSCSLLTILQIHL